MCTASAIGRGDSALARPRRSLVKGSDLAILGDAMIVWRHLRRNRIARGRCTGHSNAAVRSRGAATAAAATLSNSPTYREVWIHVDADVLDPSVMPAVDSPEPSGLSVNELVSLLARSCAIPRAAGLQLTIYDPNLDELGSGAETL